MQAQTDHVREDISLVTALSRYLDSDNEVLRSAAIRAVATLDGDPDARRLLLLEALLDPDPDIRGDAMEGLRGIALRDDAETIRRSLEGDPDREVKLDAIDLLTQIGDLGSTDLLRALVRSSSDDRVAWEAEGSDWEDWLDIQIASIAALGALGVTEAIEDLLAARDDECGQTLDVQVFRALATMGAEGTERLLMLMDQESGLGRRRVLDSLASADPDALLRHLETLLSSADAQLRGMAVPLLDPDDSRARALVVDDPDPDVRRLSICHFAPVQPDLAIIGLSDASETVQAEALDHLSRPITSELHEALVDNMLAWLQNGGSALATTTARNLPLYAPNRAEGPLLGLIEDTGRPLEARLAAVASLAAVHPAVATSRYGALLANPAQQVRVASLVALRDRAEAGDMEALTVLHEAIAGTLPLPDRPTRERPEQGGPDLALPKGEGPGVRRIRITPDGDIVEDAGRDPEAASTLDAILDEQEGGSEPELAENTPEEAGGKRRKRRPVEGPDEIAESVALDAMRLCAGLGVDPIGAAILSRCLDPVTEIRLTAWVALSSFCQVAGKYPEAMAAAQAAFSDPEPGIRLAAFSILTLGDLAPDVLAAAIKDSDALVRAAAIRHLPGEMAVELIADDALAVRMAACEAILSFGSDAMIGAAVNRLLTAERADALSIVLADAPHALRMAAITLSDAHLSPRKALVILQALANRASVRNADGRPRAEPALS
ncbi:HEAT repeat domain-containing protein [Oricola cellulosilytica]|nr:HEAT repeat domain-containing protein [Oricola cellulosilytica]